MIRILAIVFWLIPFLPPAAMAGGKAPSWMDSLEQPMKVVIVRSSAPGCEPYCPEWIMAEGKILPETPALMLSAYAEAERRTGGKGLPVILQSPGGSIIHALQIGYYLRQKGAEVAVGRTVYAGCRPFETGCDPSGQHAPYRGRLETRRAVCLSACPIILSGGVSRSAGASAIVGVHHWGYADLTGTSKGKALPGKQARGKAWDGIVRKMISDYIAFMGVSPDVVGDMDTTPFSSIKLYDARQRRALKLVTDGSGPQDFSAAAPCRPDPRPVRCVLPGDSREYRQALLMTGIYDKPGMTVVIVRDSRAGCEPRCQEWIAAKGVIRPETPQKFEAVLRQAGKARLPVLIDSAGGDLDAAMQIGRLIRQREITVIVGNVAYEGCVYGDQPCRRPGKGSIHRGVPQGTYDGCSDACAFILAAGRQRILPAGKSIMLRRPASYVPRELPGPGDTEIGLYLMEMGLGLGLAEDMRGIGPDYRRRRYGPGTSRYLSLVTSFDVSPWIAPADACRLAAPPAHCVRRRL